MIMKNINEPKIEFVDKILGIISLEKGLSENTIMAYKKDVCQVRTNILSFNLGENKEKKRKKNHLLPSFQK